MSMFKWEVVDPAPGQAVAPNERLVWGKTAGLGAQHVIAMFGATFVFPIMMGLDPNLAIMMSGIATICFLLIVKGKVPSYLGTSASFVGGASAIYAQGGGPADVTGAILVSGVVLALVGVLIHVLGAQAVNRVLPPVVTGAVVMLIGFNLAGVATDVYLPADPWIGMLTMLAVILMAVGLRGFLGRIAIFLGLIFGYLVSWLADVVFGPITSVTPSSGGEAISHDRVDWAAVQAADWFGFPGHTADGLVGNQASAGQPVRRRLAPAVLLDHLRTAGDAGGDRPRRREHRPREGGLRDDRRRPGPGRRTRRCRRRGRHCDHLLGRRVADDDVRREHRRHGGHPRLLHRGLLRRGGRPRSCSAWCRSSARSWRPLPPGSWPGSRWCSTA